MKVVVHMSSPETLNHLRSVIAQWKEEHEGYYGQPCGFKPMDNIIFFGPEIPENERAVAENYGSYYIYAGFEGIGTNGGGRWLTSGGNYAAIDFNEKGNRATIWLDGKRHGIRMPFPPGLEYDPSSKRITKDGESCGSVSRYETECPEAAPWEMDLVPAQV